VPFVKEIAVMVVRTAAGRPDLIRSWKRFIKITSVTSYSRPFEVEIPKSRCALKK